MRISMMSGCCGYQIVQPQRMWGLRAVGPGVAGEISLLFNPNDICYAVSQRISMETTFPPLL
jgi:hypothetical protein